MAEEARKPFWVKCPPCGHVWAAAYFPMDATRMAKAAKQCCPYCGHGPKGILVAKQDNGVLNEPLAPHQQTGAPA